MYSNFPLYVFYLFLKVLFRTSFALFYPYTRITGREHLNLKGPTLVATNHPNTLVDALQGASRVSEQVFFLVNASMFGSPFQRWFFETFYCIPIERPQDVQGRKINNTATFARCDAHLKRGGHLFIAPEGGSFMERRLREVKTGAARIVFSAESKNDFSLNIRILPVILNYEQPNRFGSRLLINVGAPLLAVDYRDLYRDNPREAVKQMTDDLADRMRSLLIDTAGEAEDAHLRRLEAMAQAEEPLGPRLHYHRSQVLLDEWRRRQASDPAGAAAFYELVKNYSDRIRREELTEEVAAAAMHNRPLRTAGGTAGLILGFPAFLYGLANNFFPYFIPRWIVRKLDLYVGYEATVKILAGIVTFPLFYALQLWLVSRWFDAPVPLLYFISLVPAGYFAHWYPQYARQVAARRQWVQLAPERREELLQMRRKILEGMME